MTIHKSVAFALTLLLLIASVATVTAQDEGQLQLSAQEVILDVVITDGKGRPITDIRQDEIQVFESGDRMELTSFGLVANATSTNTPTPAPGTAPLAIETSPFRGFNYVIVVVDRTSLNQQELKLTNDAAARYINERMGPNDVVSVFAAASRLVMVQNFTNSKEKLLKAMAAATDASGNVITLAQSDALAQKVDLSTIRDSNNAAGSTQQNPGGISAAIDQLNTFAADISGTFDSLVQQFQAIAIVQDLLALMKVYGAIPGRKSVLLYSEGFAVDSAVQRAFDSVIGTANRNNFAYYTVDAAGLRGESSLLINRSTEPAGGGTIVGDRNDPTIVDASGNSGLGRAERSVRTAANGALYRLADETGGVHLRNNNDLNRGFQTVASDLQSYYILSYAPKNAAFDGKFRPVDVKVTRKGAEVRTRKGYYATPGGSGSMLLPFEQAVLEMLANAKPEARPSDLPATARLERFRGSKGWAVPFVVQMPASALTPAPPEKTEKGAPESPLAFELDMVALVRDSKGAVVAKLGRSFLYRANKTDVDRFKAFELTNSFTQPLELGPGSYKVSLGLYDPNAAKGTVIERSIILPALAPGGPALSSIVLSRDVQPVAAADQQKMASDPLVFDGKAMIVPNTTAKFMKSRGDRLVVFFRFYGAPSKQYQVRMEFVKDGKVVTASQPTALPITDATGMAAFGPSIPIDGMEPGSYVVHVVIIDAETTKPVADGTSNFRVEL